MHYGQILFNMLISQSGPNSRHGCNDNMVNKLFQALYVTENVGSIPEHHSLIQLTVTP